MKKILVADDEFDIQQLVKEVLSSSGYEVFIAGNGRQTINIAKQVFPDLILLDIQMPDILGFEVCRILKAEREFKHVPIVMLTARNMETDEITGFELGVDDYITKPFKPKLLLARIQAALERTESKLSANPLTKLPGNAAILKQLEDRIQSNKPFSVFYFDLNNFKAFNDHYGFLHGDKAIQLVAGLIIEKFNALTEGISFVGHVGGDDFVAVIDSHSVDDLCRTIVEEFDQKVLDLYSDNDRRAGGILSTDRHGKPVQYPIMGLAIVVVTNKLKSFNHPGEISLIAGELKTWVKSLNKSAIAIDRRA